MRIGFYLPIKIVVLLGALCLASCRIGGELLNEESVDEVSDSDSGGDSSTAPTFLSYTYQGWNLHVGTPVVPNRPTSDVTGLTFSSEDLPDGLSIDPTTGVISGTPEAAQDAASFTVTASNSAGSINVAVSTAIFTGFYVDSTDFTTADDNPGDGICSIGGTQTGPCSLRAAFQENLASGPADVVIGPGTYHLDAEYVINSDWNLRGFAMGATILDGQKDNAILGISGAGIRVGVSDLSFQNGHNDINDGGCVYIAGVGTVVEMSSVRFKNCRAQGNGGAVYLDTATDVEIVDSQFEYNVSDSAGGAIASNGADLDLRRSMIRTNISSAHGGALYAYNGGTLNVQDSHFERNAIKAGATGQTGGAIHTDAGIGSTIIRVSFKQNYSSARGGAIDFNGGGVISNSTFIGNIGTQGGAIAALGSAITLRNSTMVGNLATSGLGSHGGALFGSANKTLQENIFSGNYSANGHDNCESTGGFITSSHNVVDTAHGDCGTNGVNGDLANTDPLVKPAGFFASRTVMTVPLSANSPAIDFTGSACIGGLADGRAQLRDGNCDIGSYEFTRQHSDAVRLERRNYIFLRGQEITPTDPPVVVGLEQEEFTILPALPEGLVFNAETGVISGTPTEVTPDAGIAYLISAMNAPTYASNWIRLTIKDGFLVDSDGDDVDQNPGDGDCATLANKCTLRAAIQETEATEYAEVIYIGDKVSTINLGSLLPVIDKDTFIVGRGSDLTTITSTSTLFRVQTDGTDLTNFVISDMTLDGSSGETLEANDANTRLDSLVFSNGTGPRAAAELANVIESGWSEVQNSRFTNNQNTSGVFGGGAIYLTNLGLAFIDRNIFDDNSATNADGGAINIQKEVFAVVQNSKFYNNSAPAGSGGSISLDEGTGTIRFIADQNGFSQETALSGSSIFSNGGEFLVLLRNLFYENETQVSPSGALLISGGSAATLFSNILSFNSDLAVDNACHGLGGFFTAGYNIATTADADCSLSTPGDDMELTNAMVRDGENTDGTPFYISQPGAPGRDLLNSGFCATHAFDIGLNYRMDTVAGGCDIGPVERQQ